METEIYKNYTINYKQDDCSESPRDWDNLGTIFYCSSSYNLGDVSCSDKDNLLYKMLYECDYDSDYIEEIMNGDNDIDPMELIEKKAILLPCFAYIHSGITINTTGFSCGWDSGQFGYIMVTKDKIRKEYGWSRISKKRRIQIESYLKGEIKTFDQFLIGDIYGYEIENHRGEFIDSCYGYYGFDEVKKEARSIIDYEIQRIIESEIPLIFHDDNRGYRQN